MRASALRRLILVAGLCVGAGGPAAARDPLTTPQLLVDLARDHALSHRDSATPADALHVRALLRAAVKLDPRQADALAWLYELAQFAGDSAAAADVLRQLVTADPGHMGAFANWLSQGLAGLQSIEKRIELLQGMIGDGRYARPQQALIHVELARLMLQNLQPAQARMQIDRALGLDPDNRDAALLQLDLLEPGTPPAVRLRSALRALRLNPLDVETAWQVGVLLDELGFADEAAQFFDHAVEVFRAANPDREPPAPYLVQRAYNLADAGRWDEAIRAAQKAVEVAPDLVEARFVLRWLLIKQNRKPEAEAHRQYLARRFAEIREPADFSANDLAQAAWFYCTIDPQPQRALLLAEAAARLTPGDPFATRVLGWAQALNLKAEEAQQTLLPLAGKDPFAAYQIAKLLRDAGDASAPQRVIRNLERLPRGGPALDLLAEFGPLGAATQPARRHPEIPDVLAEFDRDVLAFRRNVARLIDVQISVPDANLDPGDPWWTTFALTNHARYPVTLGPDAMLNPVFLLSFKLAGDREREYNHLLTIHVDRARVIPPGGTIKVRHTLDIGPLRRVNRQTPQQLQRVTATAILDPQRDPNGQWIPALTGLRLRPFYFNRVPARTGRESLHALFSALGGESDPARFGAIEVLAELLGERQRAELKQLSYNPDPIPADRIRQALLAALNADSWELRARTLDALQVVGLDQDMLEAARACLRHNHWLVRLLAVRLIARQGKEAVGQIQPLADRDPEELVRDIARSYLMTWGLLPQATQPAAVPPPARPPPGGP